MAEKLTATDIGDVLRPFLRPGDRVLLCCPDQLNGVAEAVQALGSAYIGWRVRGSWQALLRQVFSHRVTVLVGMPKLILGLAKIARITGTPLPVRHVVLLEQSVEDWLYKGIRDSLDAQIHTCNLSCSPETDPLRLQLDEMLLSWSSILDYRASRTQQGLSLEIIVFPGRKLPQLPSGASITVRPWEPKTDIPMCLPEW